MNQTTDDRRQTSDREAEYKAIVKGVKILFVIIFMLFITLLRNQIREIGSGFYDFSSARIVSGSALFFPGCPVCLSQGSFIDLYPSLDPSGWMAATDPDANRPAFLTKAKTNEDLKTDY